MSKLEKIELYALSMHARDLQKNLRFVDYKRAEQLSEQLADKLRGLFSKDELAEFSFFPIPRGGFIVLGMLAYALNLRADQLLIDPIQDNKPLIIVDDCALTGFRFNEYLEKIRAHQVVFAHLFSAEALRHGIQQREKRVTYCIAAQDLAERPLSTASSSPGSHLYWSGSSELVAFAWSEPSLLTSLLSSDKSTANWHLIPPQECLNNRIALAVQGTPAANPIIYVPNNLLYQWNDGILLLADSNSGEYYKLENKAAAMWRALAVLGHPVQALNWLQTKFEIDQESVETFMETAVSAGILSQISPISAD